MIAVCLKLTAHPGHADDDARFAGVSLADRAALEVALRLAAACDDQVLAVSVGPAAAAHVLREALACGAGDAVHIEQPPGGDSRDVARELAEALRGARAVVCGDHSLDRGSGSVPAFVAHHLGAAQGLGLVDVITAEGSTVNGVHAVRRVDGGRREVLRVGFPCVLSVEGSAATLRRASLRNALAGTTGAVQHRVGAPPRHAPPPTLVAPFRPRPRAMAAPTSTDVLERLRLLTDAIGAPARGETVELPPRAAAERIIAALRSWGYVE